MKRITIFLLFISVSFLSFAETIILKSGEKIEGKIIERNDKFIKIDFQDIPLTYYLEDIESVDNKKTVLPAKDSSPANVDVPKQTNNTKYFTNTKDNVSIATNDKYAELLNEGKELGQRGLYNEAIAKLEQAVQVDPNDYAAYVNLGNCYTGLKQPQKALEYFQKAYSLNHKSVSALSGFGNCYFLLNDYEKAIPYLQQAIEIAPDAAYLYENMAGHYYNLGQYKEAKKYYLKAKELSEKQNDHQAAADIEPFLKKLQNVD